MRVFVTGTDTDIGKTIVSSWLCLHTGYDYFKPLQSGNLEQLDSKTVLELSSVRIHAEHYLMREPLSPHMAAERDGIQLEISNMPLPSADNLLIEGAGGVLVPLNQHAMIVDLIKHYNVPVIVVARASLGTINHTVLTLEALRARGVEVLGVVTNGVPNPDNVAAIEHYGHTQVLAQLPQLSVISREALQGIPLPIRLQKLFL